ncbi:MAG: hypothetical protein GY704_01510 [Phycisphaeraceae bacterium]|nr:hypothetical protein [Phycisphaeraceae bacterium]
MDIPGIDIPGPGDIIGGIGGFLGGLAGDAASAIIELVLGIIFGFVADAVSAITSALAPTFNGDSTRVDLTGGWFSTDGGSSVTAMTSVIAGSLVLVFLLLALVRALFAGEFSAMWRASLIDVPVAFLGTALTVIVASALLEIVDVASIGLLGANGEQLAAFSESLADAERLTGAGLLGILFGLLFIVGAVLVWIQLLVRAALIYIVIAFAPILWVTRAYPGTRSISRRGIEIGLGLIASKFVMAVSFRLGAEAMRSGGVAGDEVDLSAMLGGSAIMLLTAFMPMAVFKVVPIVESATAASGADKAVAGAAVVGAGAALGGSLVAAKLAGSAVGSRSNSSGGADAGGGGDSGGGSTVVPGAGGGSGGDSGGEGGGTSGPQGRSGETGPSGSSGGGAAGRAGRAGETDSTTGGAASAPAGSGSSTGGGGEAITVESVGGSGVGVAIVEAPPSSGPRPASKSSAPSTSGSSRPVSPEPLGSNREEKS